MSLKKSNHQDDAQKQFNQCCGEVFKSLSEVERIELITKAFKMSPAYKIRQKIGLKLCPGGLNISVPGFKGDSFDFEVYTNFCR
jgi:hypothetical protein